MDGFRHPVGEQPTTVYWRRRLAVLIAVVALGALIWVVFSSLGGSDEPGTVTSPDPTTSPSSSPSADLSRACTGADITLALTASPASFAVGAPATFTATATAIGDRPCLITPTGADSAFTIRSGDVPWFDSTLCPDAPAFGDQPVLMQPGATHDFTLTWNGGRDANGCAAGGDATAGYYWIEATLQGIAAEPFQFQIT